MILYRTCWTRKVIDLIDMSQPFQGRFNIVAITRLAIPAKGMHVYILDECESFMLLEMSQMLRGPGLKAIDANYFMAFCKEEVD